MGFGVPGSQLFESLVVVDGGGCRMVDGGGPIFLTPIIKSCEISHRRLSLY